MVEECDALSHNTGTLQTFVYSSSDHPCFFVQRIDSGKHNPRGRDCIHCLSCSPTLAPMSADKDIFTESGETSVIQKPSRLMLDGV